MGVSVSMLEHAIPGLDLKDTPVSKIAVKIAAAVAAITAKSEEAPRVSNSGSDIDAARAEAANKLGDMDTDGALAVWNDMLAKDSDALESLTRRRIVMLGEKASIQRLQLNYVGTNATLHEIVRLDPDSIGHWSEIGDVESTTGTLANAQSAFQSALEASRRIGNERDVSMSLNRVGDVRRARNDLAGALKVYEESLEIDRRLMALDPSHAERAHDVSVSLSVSATCAARATILKGL